MIPFILSMLLTTVYVYKWQKHFEVNITMIFALIPLISLIVSLPFMVHDRVYRWMFSDSFH